MRRAYAAGAIVAAFGLAAPALAQDFYKGANIRYIVGYPPGSTFDTYSRLLSRHMGKHIPGRPVIVIQNMPGAGSLTATNYLANVAAKDGSVIGMPNPVNTVEPLLRPQAARFDPRKLSWIGSMNTEIATCGFWGEKVSNVDDLRNKNVVVGSTGPSSGSTLDATVLASVLGLNFKIVTGYPGLAEVRLAAQQGEVDGHCGLLVSSLKADIWEEYKKGIAKVPIQMGLSKHPELPEVPNAFDMTKTAEDRQVLTLVFGPWSYGRPVAAPEGVPVDRLKTLRAAFMASMDDADLKIEAGKLNLELQPRGPDFIEKTVADIYKTPPAVIERARKLLGIPAN